MWSNKAVHKGFGLIEVMTSLVVMIIVVGATGVVTKQSVNTALGAQESIVAAGLAQEVMESARYARDKTPGGPIELTYDREVVLNNINYSRDVKIEDINDDGVVGGIYWRISVTVNWRDNRTNKDREYTLEENLTQWPS